MTDGTLNWNGFYSAEPPALEFWGWSKSAAKSADRLRYLSDTTGSNYISRAQDVLTLTKLRNAFAHADGILMKEEDRRLIESWISRHQDLVDATGHAIRLKEGFVSYSLALYDRTLSEIAKAVVEKMQSRTAGQGPASSPEPEDLQDRSMG